MANFESGVSGYVVGECVIKVSFPIDFKGHADISCRHCPFLSSNERMCQLNKEPVAFPNKYVGDKCPLKPKTNEEGEVKND
jgi:hypothetical protein